MRDQGNGRRQQLLIGDLARRAAVTTRAIRHYHAVGIMPEPLRDSSGYRRYAPQDLERLVRIRDLRQVGMPISDIGRLLDREGAGQPVDSTARALTALASDLGEEIERLHRVRDRLSGLVEAEGQ